MDKPITFSKGYGVADLGTLRRLYICPQSLCVPRLGVSTADCHCMQPQDGWVFSKCC